MTTKGVMIWKGKYVFDGDLKRTAEYLHELGINRVDLKIGDHASDHSRSYPDMKLAVRTFKNYGMSVYAWHYVYGGLWVDSSGTVHTTGMPSPATEARFAKDQVLRNDMDGYFIDAEHEYKVYMQVSRANLFMKELTYGWDSKKPILLCSYRYPNYHLSFPWSTFLKYCTHHAPQVYWGQYANAARNELLKSYEQLSNFKQLPFLPVGRAYIGDGHSYPTPEEITQFLETSEELKCVGASFWSLDAIAGQSGGYYRGEAIKAFQFPDQAPTIPPAPPTPQYPVRSVRAYVLNVRSSPCINSHNVIGGLLRGTKVTIYEERNGWSRIDPSEQEWVYTYWLTKA